MYLVFENVPESGLDAEVVCQLLGTRDAAAADAWHCAADEPDEAADPDAEDADDDEDDDEDDDDEDDEDGDDDDDDDEDDEDDEDGEDAPPDEEAGRNVN